MVKTSKLIRSIVHIDATPEHRPTLQFADMTRLLHQWILHFIRKSLLDYNSPFVCPKQTSSNGLFRNPLILGKLTANIKKELLVQKYKNVLLKKIDEIFQGTYLL